MNSSSSIDLIIALAILSQQSKYSQSWVPSHQQPHDNWLSKCFSYTSLVVVYSVIYTSGSDIYTSNYCSNYIPLPQWMCKGSFSCTMDAVTGLTPGMHPVNDRLHHFATSLTQLYNGCSDRADPRYAPSQWQTASLCYISHSAVQWMQWQGWP